ncbi:helix-turn-helix transcriptional regulator [Falsihalocynthiibacter sp. BN13B15]|uniref:helix-turn-helix transcriptional regulator n=1 Tax=Falsihalocynthiibacter sp. BN13B15 TaxID=3240871 RepID=UPI0035104623
MSRNPRLTLHRVRIRRKNTVNSALKGACIPRHCYTNREIKGRSMQPTESQSRTPKILLGYEDLKVLGVSYSREHLRRLEAAGHFPLRIRLSPGRIAWKLIEIEKWIETRPVGISSTDFSE